MSVYVDRPLDFGWRYGPNAHMMADSVEELHAFADRLGLKREWFQDKPHCRHYDLTVKKWNLAKQHGAVELSLMDFCRKMRELHPIHKERKATRHE